MATEKPKTITEIESAPLVVPFAAPDIVTPEEAQAQEQAQVHQRRAEHRTEMTSDEVTRAILDEWEGQGVDVSDPDVILAASTQALRNAWRQDPNGALMAASTASMVQNFGTAQFSSYSQALAAHGLDDYLFPQEPLGTTTPSEVREPTTGAIPEGFAGQAYAADEFGPRGYHADPVSGAILYRNGVLADPNTGDVFFPPDAEAAGSPLWLRDAQRGWSDEKVAEWKHTLVQAGYLPKDALKDEGWTISFRDALRDFNVDRYLNYGVSLTKDATAGGFGGGTQIQNLRSVEATIRQDITNQYLTVFNEAPTADELQTWTAFIVRTGNKLQRKKELDPGTAAAEATARFSEQLTGSPQGKLVAEAEKENTSLHDALTTAISATRGLA